MTAIHSLTAVAIVAVVAATPAASVQAPASPDALEVAQAAVTQCAQAHPQADRTIELANTRLELARQSNSAAAMRAAIDDLQASLRQVRTDIAPCARVQTASAGEHAGHVMPNAVQPPAAPRTPVVAPGSPAPVAVNRGAAAPVADPHAGHVMPGAPPTATPAAPPVAVPRPQSSTAKPTAPDPHAGHVIMPTTKPGAAKPAAADAHAGHVAPESPAQANTSGASATEALTVSDNPAARLADLACRPRVDPDTAPRATYLGKAYYFCTTADRDAFLKAPTKYLQQ